MAAVVRVDRKCQWRPKTQDSVLVRVISSELLLVLQRKGGKRQVLLGEEFFALPQISCQSASRQFRKGQRAEQVSSVSPWNSALLEGSSGERETLRGLAEDLKF